MNIGKYKIDIRGLMILFVVLFTSSVFGSNPVAVNPSLENLPVIFRKNMGQWDSKILYRGTSYAWNADAYFMKDRLCYVFSRPAQTTVISKVVPEDDVEERFEEMMWNVFFKNANTATVVTADGMEDSHTNFFLGKDPSRFVRNAPDYKIVRYQDMYPGIDVKYYGTGKELKYDVIVKPGANITDMQMQFNGVGSVSLNHKGELEINTAWGTLVEELPESYQIIQGKKQRVKVSYALLNDHTVGFRIFGKYNKGIELVIDPINLKWRTYAGGKGQANGYMHDMTTDAQGNAYCVGYYNDYFDFSKLTAPVYDNGYNGPATPNGSILKSGDVILYKISPDGKKLLWATYVGGSAHEQGTALRVNPAGEVFVTGTTFSSDFPVTAGAYKTTFGASGENTFAFKIDASGANLTYSTFLGGNIIGIPGIATTFAGIAINAAGEAYVCGTTTGANFTPINALQATYGGGTHDAYLIHLNANGTGAYFATYLGGSAADHGSEMEVDAAGNVYMVGFTSSPNYPVTAGSYDGSANGGMDVFVTKVAAGGASLVYSSLLGGASDEYALDMELNPANELFVVGYTNGNSVPTTPAAYRKTANNRHAFLTKFNQAGSALVFSTYIAASGNEYPYSVKVNKYDNVYVGGSTSGTTTTTQCAYQSTKPQGTGVYTQDLFISKFDATGSVLMFGTYVGGESQDYWRSRISLKDGECENDTITGGVTTHSGSFPTPYYANAGEVYMPHNQVLGGDYDQHAVYKLVPPEPIANFYHSQIVQCNTPVQFTDSTYGPCVNWTVNWKPTSWKWTFGDGGTSTQQNPTHVYAEAGTYQVTLIIGCPADTIVKTVVVDPGQNCNVKCTLVSNVTTTTATCGNADGTAHIASTGAHGDLTFTWIPVSTADSIANNLSAGNYTVIIADTMNCKDTVTFVITTPNGPTADSIVTDVTCPGGNDGAVDLVINGGASPYDVSWDNGALTQDINGLTPGTYQATITDANNCVATLTAIVSDTTLPALSVSLPADTTVCMTANINIQSLVAGGNGVYSYSWSTGETTQNITVSPLFNTTVTVTVDDACGSGPVTDNMVITVKPAPVVNFTANDTDGCSPVCVQFTDLTTPSGGICQWTFGDGAISDVCGQNDHCYVKPGSFDVTLTVDDGVGCITSHTRKDYIEVFGFPEADFEANPQPTTIYDPTIYFTDLSDGAVTWAWDFGDSTNSTDQSPKHNYNPEVPKTYTVALIVENEHGCTDTIIKTVEIQSDWTIFVPNSFTPNGDGKNNFFIPVGTGIDEFEMWIYDRWGNEIFHSTGLNDPWNGTVQGGTGGLVQIDTYVWLIRFKDNTLQSHVYTGHVNVLR